MVSGAVAGEDIRNVARSASDALNRSVAIALPSLGEAIVYPAGLTTPEAASELAEHAAAVIAGASADQPEGIAEAVPIRIGQRVVGLVAALGPNHLESDERAWLEGAAAAAAVSALMRESQGDDLKGSRKMLVQTLAQGPPTDVAILLGQARRLGIELEHGAVGICARGWNDSVELDAVDAPGLLADARGGRLLGLVASPAPGRETAEQGADVADELRTRGLQVAVSTPRRDPATLHEALREAELLLELATDPGALLDGQEETYRLLIGVRLRNPDELELLRGQTIALIGTYDREHGTELIATLREFLAHHGSTTETAEAMRLHRHTVGYRLSRVQEVSGLSPYESDGRERLSLGLKAHHILNADKRRAERE